MTASAPIPAAEAASHMPNPPDTTPTTPRNQVPSQVQTAAAAPTLRSQVAENPLLSFFGLMIIALLAAAIAAPNIRINDTNARIDRLDARMTARFDKVDAEFEDVDANFEDIDARLDGLDLKLTALIAKLDATDVVDAAIEGRLREPA